MQYSYIAEQPKPVVNNNQQDQPSEDNPNEIIKGKDQKGGQKKQENLNGDGQEFGPPPSPGGEKLGKKG